VTRNAIHTLLAVLSLVLIGLGLWFVYWPLCPLAIGSLLLAGIIYARTLSYEHHADDQQRD
jgi:uncharacterized membrane protein YgdD (TMEM256/DUF423 family)